MKKIKSFVLVFLVSLFSFNNITYSQDIPIIVISPGKTPQSYDKVGSSISVITNSEIEESSNLFISDVIGSKTNANNLFQMGGHGTNTGIQLRGLEKRFSTVYIDGVKMSDPSSPDNSFYMESIMKSSIERVEILKGNQSSLYGSNAIGGTIHIFTKKGKEGNHSNLEIETGSNNTKNISYSINGANTKFDYYLGLNKFLTSGISAMNHNNEDDKYRNQGVIGTAGYQLNENFRIENSLRYTNSILNYDTPNISLTQLNNRTDNIEGTYSLKLKHGKDKFKNTLSFNKTYIERAETSDANAYTSYFGFRDAINLTGEYNFNLDNKIVYGAEAEFDAARYPSDYAPAAWNWKKRLSDKRADEHIFSQYFDYQFRPFENLYSTFGLRSDEHSTTGRKASGRTTLAYKLDGNSKIRSSLGSGIRFPSLYDYHYADGNTPASGAGTAAPYQMENLKAERALSYDFGYDTYLDFLDLDLSITYFNIEQKNPLVSDSRNNWKLKNQRGESTSEGIELSADWQPKDRNISFGMGYTFTDTYDSNTCDAGDCNLRGGGSKMATAKVRVPRNAFLANINHATTPNLKNTLSIKFVDETRDFGNTNNSFKDVILDDYMTFNFYSTYKLFDSYNLFFNVINIFDEEYEQALQYSSMGRAFNFGMKRSF